jgi:hypothetical protein
MRRMLFTGLLAGALGVCGCSNNDPEVRQQVQGIREQMRDATSGARRAAADAGLEAKVKSAIETRKGLEGSRIDVEAKGDMITLKGDVMSRDQAELAEKVAMETNGVASISNQLMLRVPAKSSEPTVQPLTPEATPGAAAVPSETGR